MEEEKQKVLLKYNSNWVERQAITNITEYDFIELLNELEDRKEISRARLREIMKQFTTLRSVVKVGGQQQLKQYDDKWIEQQVLSNIGNDDFFKILDDLEDNREISRVRSREMVKEYTELKRKFEADVFYSRS